MEKRASARWLGSLKEGKGTVSLESGGLRDASYGFATRFAGEKGINPEELLAAAHAACFSMAFSAELGKRKVTPEEIRTDATVRIEQKADGWQVTQSHIDVFAKVPKADRAIVEEAANAAKVGCPISRALSMPITMKSEIQT